MRGGGQNDPSVRIHICIKNFGLKACRKIFLQFFALEHSVSKAKHCRSVLGQILRSIFRYKAPPLINRQLPDCFFYNFVF